MKKLLILAALAAVGFVVYQQIAASRAEQDLWTEATSAPDLR
ncbi:MAG: DLW-39 family protein [Candidatus Nanopelagicales bacterium]